MTKYNKFIDKIINTIEIHKRENNENKIPNLLFYGNSLAEINKIVMKICNILNDDDKINRNNILFVDCIFNSSIINIRNIVQQFIKSKFHKKQGFKIIIFNHLDELTDEAQCALRVLMEQNNTNLFIGIASQSNKIVMPILSRMMLISTSSICSSYNKNNSLCNKTIDSIICKYKYNKYTHLLFSSNKNNKNINMIIDNFDNITNEISKLKNIQHIEILFKELYKLYIKTYNSHIILDNNIIMCNKITYIRKLLINYISNISNISN